MQLTTGKVQKAQKIVIYGPEGIGKTTLANQFPSPVFIDIEGSTNWMDVSRLACGSWHDILEAVKYLKAKDHKFKTAVFDTADWAERFCVQHICRNASKSSIEDFGYGKGYTYLAEEFGRLLTSLNLLVESGMNVIFVAHCTVKKLELPDETGSYDHYEFKCTRQTSPLLKEWAEAVLFVNYHVFVRQDDNKRAKAIGGRKRIIHTQHTAAYDAKNRSDLPDQIPFELPFDFSLISKILGDKTTTVIPKAEPPEDNLDMSPPAAVKVVKADIETDKMKKASASYNKLMELKKLVAGIEPEALAWLVEKKWLTDGQKLGELSDDKIKQILARPTEFKQAIKAKKTTTKKGEMK